MSEVDGGEDSEDEDGNSKDFIMNRTSDIPKDLEVDGLLIGTDTGWLAVVKTFGDQEWGFQKTKAIMAPGNQRRSARISEQDEKKAQAESQTRNTRKAKAPVRDLGYEADNADLKRRRKNIKTKSILDLVSISTQDELPQNSGVKISENLLPERRMLGLLLDKLKSRDHHNIFAKPVNPDEAKGYYDVIKEPMDFGTISGKLDGGSYQTLEEFEYDVTLVHKNAMLFNSSTTIYYLQGLYIRDLAQKFFALLKSDHERFELEVSNTRQRGSRRIATGVQSSNSGTPGQSAARTTSKGGRGRQDQDENDELAIYRSWGSFLNDNESVMSLLYKNPDPSSLEMETKLGRVGFEKKATQLFKALGLQNARMVVDSNSRSIESEASDSHTQTGIEEGGTRSGYTSDPILLDRIEDTQSAEAQADPLAPAEWFTLPGGTGSVSTSARLMDFDLNLSPPDSP